MHTARFPGVILAGGAATRMGGGDKPLISLQNKPILTWIIDRVGPQLAELAINANGNPKRFEAYPYPVLPDQVADLGPMAGILAAMVWGKQIMPHSTHVLIVPGDTPFLPLGLVDRLSASAPAHPLAISTAKSGNRLHPTIALWPLAAQSEVAGQLRAGNGQRVLDWLDQLGSVPVEWPIVPYDPFFNINTPENRTEGERIAKNFF